MAVGTLRLLELTSFWVCNGLLGLTELIELGVTSYELSKDFGLVSDIGLLGIGAFSVIIVISLLALLELIT